MELRRVLHDHIGEECDLGSEVAPLSYMALQNVQELHLLMLLFLRASPCAYC